MTTGSYQFTNFINPEKEKKRLNLQAKILENHEIEFLKNAGLKEKRKVLDLGCGLGNTIHMIQKHFANIELFGTDTNSEFLMHCRQNFDGINFFESNVYELGMQEEKFDFIYARFLFQHLSDPTKALQEISKILNPGGVLVILDVDDNFLQITPTLKCFDKFLELVQKSQAARGGDRTIGHKIKTMLENESFSNIKETLQIIESSSIGLRNFLDLTTGLKLEQVSNKMRAKAEELLLEIYTEAFAETIKGKLTLFGISCTK